MLVVLHALELWYELPWGKGKRRSANGVCAAPDVQNIKMKIIDKITASQASKTPFFSFEFFPPRSAAGVENLYKRVDRMAALNPLFVSVTWNAASSDATIEVASKLQRLAGVDVLMHLTLAGMSVAQLKAALERARHL